MIAVFDYIIKYIMTNCKVSGPCLLLLLFIAGIMLYIVSEIKDLKEQNKVMALQLNEAVVYIAEQNKINDDLKDDISENRKDIELMKRVYIK